MVNTEIRLIMLFDREALYSLQKKKKKELELRLAQIMSSLLQLNCKIQAYIEDSRENNEAIQAWPKSIILRLYSGGNE